MTRARECVSEDRGTSKALAQQTLNSSKKRTSAPWHWCEFSPRRRFGLAGCDTVLLDDLRRVDEPGRDAKMDRLANSPD